ncbi:hypothetical protein GOQ04_09590 [Emticicia sp. ODNR4P]|jgi:hypothetical protein|nr:hypothetical protein [Emticicia sp. ODNR4P]
MRLSTLLYTALIVCVTFLLSCNSNYLEPKTISSQELQKDPSFKYVSKKVFEDNMILLDRVKTLNITDLNSTLARDSIVALLESDEQAFDAFVDITYLSLEYIQNHRELQELPINQAEAIFDKALKEKFRNTIPAGRTVREDPEEFDCLMKAIGLDVLVEQGLTRYGVKQLSKSMLKTVLKKSVPYIGWGFALYELGDCMDWW